jgi:hypothetical protein
VRFRAGAGDWYTVRMVAAEGEWRASLPRPLASLPRFQYQVSLTGTDAASATTDPIPVEVRSDCAVAGAVAVAAIAVQVPPGAPLVPPVPAGFSPVGATGPVVARNGHRGLKILGAGVVAAAGGGLATVVGSSTPAESSAMMVLPGFVFDGTSPAPGSTINPRDGLTIFMRLDPQPDRPVDVPWSVQLLSTDGVTCATMIGRLPVVYRETRLTLRSTIALAPARCGASFDIGSLRLTVGSSDVERDSSLLPLKYRYEG